VSLHSHPIKVRPSVGLVPPPTTRLVIFSHSYQGLAARAHYAPPLRGYFHSDLEVLFHY